MRLLALVFVAVLLGGCSSPPKEEGVQTNTGTTTSTSSAPLPVDAPLWRVNSQWTFSDKAEFINEDGSREPFIDATKTLKVVDVNACGEPPCRYRAQETAVDSDGTRVAYWLFDKDTLAREEEGTENGEGPGFPFPLVKGDSGRIGGFDYRVSALREMSVAAGTFDAFRIDLTLDERGVSSAYTLWYAPAVQWVIRDDSRVESHSDGLVAEIHRELLSFQLG